MSLCPNDGGHCQCQPDEGVPCPIKPTSWWRKVWALYVFWREPWRNTRLSEK